MSVSHLQVIELVRAARDVLDAGFVCSPELWRRLERATVAIEPQLVVACEHSTNQAKCEICQRAAAIEAQRDTGEP